MGQNQSDVVFRRVRQVAAPVGGRAPNAPGSKYAIPYRLVTTEVKTNTPINILTKAVTGT